jgi:2-polyprenyl-3-methyl-5-hydroxy-6-metoxy-1,4-benzoquinol methylase
MTRDAGRERAQELAREHRARGDAFGWFERLYSEARGDQERVPWADEETNPLLADWLRTAAVDGRGKRALVVGSGLGDDAEGLARAGFAVSAFDLSPTAIEWCKKRFPKSPVDYRVADLFAAPAEWSGAFDIVFECYTIHALPLGIRERAFEPIANFVAPGGTLVVVARGADEHGDPNELPLPLTRKELARFDRLGFVETGFIDVMEGTPLPLRRFRAIYRR